jgi:hypothetical protein
MASKVEHRTRLFRTPRNPDAKTSSGLRLTSSTAVPIIRKGSHEGLLLDECL